jgi:hypothetical protein
MCSSAQAFSLNLNSGKMLPELSVHLSFLSTQYTDQFIFLTTKDKTNEIRISITAGVRIIQQIHTINVSVSVSAKRIYH